MPAKFDPTFASDLTGRGFLNRGGEEAAEGRSAARTVLWFTPSSFASGFTPCSVPLRLPRSSSLRWMFRLLLGSGERLRH